MDWKGRSLRVGKEGGYWVAFVRIGREGCEERLVGRGRLLCVECELSCIDLLVMCFG